MSDTESVWVQQQPEMVDVAQMGRDLAMEVANQQLCLDCIVAIMTTLQLCLGAISHQLRESHWLHLQLGLGSRYYRPDSDERRVVSATIAVTGLTDLGRKWLVSNLAGTFAARDIREAWHDRRTSLNIDDLPLTVAGKPIKAELHVICSEYRWGESCSIIYRPLPSWESRNNIFARTGVRSPDDPEYGRPHL